jgi:CxxC motif-containing protein (DUF1111 family)
MRHVALLALAGCAHVEMPRSAEVCEPPVPADADGEELFARVWTEGDPRAAGGDGLGPIYNEASCVACHAQGGVGGGGPADKNVRLLTVRGETRVKHRVGAPKVREPATSLLVGTGFFPFPTVSERNTPALFGAGLVDRVPESAIVAGSLRPVPKGISGRPALDEEGRAGRFGWKGQIADLETFVAKACANELGLDVPTAAQPSSDQHPPPPRHDLDDEDLAALTAYVSLLPAPEEVPHPDRELGEALFDTVGCAGCHSPALGGVEGLYSDLLLHDMGPDLADGASGYGIVVQVAKSDGPASAQEWRTPPLWGVADSGPWLHDGRALTLDEAVRLHEGEAAAVTKAYRRLPEADRQALLAFLGTLTAPASPERSPTGG